jgi:hypothetical protein
VHVLTSQRATMTGGCPLEMECTFARCWCASSCMSSTPTAGRAAIELFRKSTETATNGVTPKCNRSMHTIIPPSAHTVTASGASLPYRGPSATTAAVYPLQHVPRPLMIMPGGRMGCPPPTPTRGGPSQCSTSTCKRTDCRYTVLKSRCTY